MKSKFQMLAAAVCAFVFVSCNDAPANGKKYFDMDKAKADIQAMEDAFAAGEKAKDAKAVAAYYADDAISYSRNLEPTTGKAAIEARIAKRLSSDTATVDTYKIVDLFGNEEHLVEIGSWISKNAAGAEADKGHYMSYFEKRNGKFVCVRDMTVSSMPAKPAM